MSKAATIQIETAGQDTTLVFDSLEYRNWNTNPYISGVLIEGISESTLIQETLAV